MTSFIANSLQYYGAGAAVIAAIIVAIEPGRRWMGVAMVIYVSSSIALIAWGFLQPQAKGRC